MKLSVLVLIIAAVGLPALAQPATSVEERIRRIENGLVPHVAIAGAPPVRMRLVDRMAHYRAAGVSVAVVNDGRVEWARGWGVRARGAAGPVDAGTLFAAGSISKPVTALGALRLVQDGRLALTGDVNARLRSWKIPDNDYTRFEKVSLFRLLNHTSGLPVLSGDGSLPPEPLPSLVEALSGSGAPAAPQFTPGARQQYSNGGYGVIQLLMSDATGQPFDALMREQVFAPAGMDRSRYLPQLPRELWSAAARGHGSVSGEPVDRRLPSSPALSASGLWTTPTDLGRFIAALQAAKAGAPGALLSRDNADLMLVPNRNEWSLGLQVMTGGRTPWFWHDGSVPGFFAVMVGFNATGQGAVVMINEDMYHGLKLAHEILLGIAAEYGWPDYGPIEKALHPADPARYGDYAGLYEIDEGYPVTVVARNGRLFLIWALGGVFEMHPEGPDRFFIVREGAPTYAFDRGPDGRVTGVTRTWHGGAGAGARTPLAAPAPRGRDVFGLRGHPDALVVSLVGAFNGWKPQQTPCAREAGGWVCRTDLPSGDQAYAFLVDNERVLDPANVRRARDPDGAAVSLRPSQR